MIRPSMIPESLYSGLVKEIQNMPLHDRQMIAETYGDLLMVADNAGHHGNIALSLLCLSRLCEAMK